MRCGESQNNPGHAQWNIFFFRREGHAFDTRERLIETHPLVANAGRQPAKADGDHLSSYNLGFHTKRNFSVLFGWTKHGDGEPRRDKGLQMTHLWMRLTRGNQGPDGGGERDADFLPTFP